MHRYSWVSIIIAAIIAVALMIFVAKTMLHFIVIGLALAIIIGGVTSFDRRDKYSHMKQQTKKNIYGRPLSKCETRGAATKGSQQLDHTCSEIGGGFHQICVEDIGKGKGFSSVTGQPDWSEGLKDRNHCVCLGVWANCVAKTPNDKTLKCDAIPKYALDPKYVSHWKKWNDATVEGQERLGLEELYRQCHRQAPSVDAADNLRSKYCKLVGCTDVRGVPLKS